MSRPGKTTALVEELKQTLRDFGEVRAPGDAEQPILARGVQMVVFGWLYEINNAAELAAVGLKPRSTALFYGPPGCGKTTLAHHLAARLGVPMVLVGAENLTSKWFGESEGRTARLFDILGGIESQIVVLFDEIDAIGGIRASTAQDGARASTAMLTVLLRKIEDFKGILIAATNRQDNLDSALWRRFGMQIDVTLPDDDARYAILKRYGEPFQFDDDMIEALTDLTAGASPALLRQLMEGVKRALVIGSKIGLPAADPQSAFGAVIGAVAPHPSYTPPPLWQNPRSLAILADMPWPPRRTDR